MFIFHLLSVAKATISQLRRGIVSSACLNAQIVVATYLTEMFVKLSDAWRRELRNTKTDLVVPHRKSAFGQKCFSKKVRNGGMLVQLKSNHQRLIIHPKAYQKCHK